MQNIASSAFTILRTCVIITFYSLNTREAKFSVLLLYCYYAFTFLINFLDPLCFLYKLEEEGVMWRQLVSVCPSTLPSLTEYSGLTSWTDFLKILYERLLLVVSWQSRFSVILICNKSEFTCDHKKSFPVFSTPLYSLW